MKLPTSIIRKIAVFRALQLGDMLCAVPALRALRAAYPRAEIVLLGLPWASAFPDRFSRYLDRFVHFPGYIGLPEQPYNPVETSRFIQEMRREKFDLLLQMQGNGSIVNKLLSRFGAANLAGFCQDCQERPGPYFVSYPDRLPEIHRHLSLMDHLGIGLRGDYLEFPITDKDREQAGKLLLPITPGSYVVVHPGSRGAWRQWPPVFFAALADYCIENGLTVILTGVAEEADVIAEVKKCMRHTPIDVSGKTSLGAVAALINEAFALISNCTGVSHIAAALQTHSLVVSMDGEPQRWAPLDKSLHTVVDASRQPEFEKMFLETVRLCNLRQAVAV